MIMKNILLIITFCCMFAADVAYAQSSCVAPPSGLVSWYRAEDNGNDVQGNNNGTLLNGVTFASGKVGQVFSFDGINDQVIIPSRPVQNDFTIEFWLKTTQVAFQETQWYNGAGLVDAEVSAPVNDFGTALGNGKVLFGTGNPDVTIKSGFVADGNWHHVAATRIRSTGRLVLYIDGAQVASGTGGTQSLTAPNRMVLGSLQTNIIYFNGLIDEASIYNRALSATEVQSIYNADTAGKCLPPSAASVSIGGRVLTDFGRGVAKARVSLTDSNGETRTTLTNPFGYYWFEEVAAGETYVFSVSHKRYSFAPQVLSVTEEISDLNFTAE